MNAERLIGIGLLVAVVGVLQTVAFCGEGKSTPHDTAGDTVTPL